MEQLAEFLAELFGLLDLFHLLREEREMRGKLAAERLHFLHVDGRLLKLALALADAHLEDLEAECVFHHAAAILG